MSEQSPSSDKTPEMELFKLVDQQEPGSVDAVFLGAVAEGITEARLDQHRLDEILDDEV